MNNLITRIKDFGISFFSFIPRDWIPIVVFCVIMVVFALSLTACSQQLAVPAKCLVLQFDVNAGCN